MEQLEGQEHRQRAGLLLEGTWSQHWVGVDLKPSFPLVSAQVMPSELFVVISPFSAPREGDSHLCRDPRFLTQKDKRDTGSRVAA